MVQVAANKSDVLGFCTIFNSTCEGYDFNQRNTFVFKRNNHSTRSSKNDYTFV